MRRLLGLAQRFGPLAMAVMLALGSALVVPAVSATDGNTTLVYRGGSRGKVLFDGRIHAAQGITCNTCHAALFDTHKSGLITEADHDGQGKCFACHGGDKPGMPKATSNCKDCPAGSRRTDDPRFSVPHSRAECGTSPSSRAGVGAVRGAVRRLQQPAALPLAGRRESIARIARHCRRRD